MKTVLFLASALCGGEFALEYSKLVFFDKSSPHGHGIGHFRKILKPKKGRQRRGSPSQENEEAVHEEPEGDKASYQIGKSNYRSF
jgi:hypothetical protein